VGLRIAASLMKCGQCGKRYSNPLTHVCYNPRGKGPRLQVRPRVAVDCPRCGKPVTNPLAHVCSVRTDFRKRLAEQKKAQARARRKKARAAAPQHDYHCTDPDCHRRMCLAYRDGLGDGEANCPLDHI
jgi:endogenous inhibitor of DNA gyrase (YacG/DUF329 family)